MESTNSSTNSSPKNKSRLLLYGIIVLCGLLLPVIIYLVSAAPILTGDMADEITYARFLATHKSASDLWISTREFFPLSLRFFLKIFSDKDWSVMLRNASLCCYAVYSLCFAFFVFALHSKKIITYIIGGICAALFGYYGLHSLYACNYFLSYISALLLLSGLILNAIKLHAPAKIRIIVAIASFMIIIISVASSVVIARKNNWSFRKISFSAFADIISTPLWGTGDTPNTAENISELSEYLQTLDTDNIYTLSDVSNIVSTVTDGAITPAYINTVLDLHPYNMTDRDLSVYDTIESDSKKVYLIIDNASSDTYSHYPAFSSLEYQDNFYTVYSYPEKDLILYAALYNDIEEISNASYDTYYISALDISTYDLHELYRTRLWNTYSPENLCTSVPAMDALNEQIFLMSPERYILEFDPYNLYISLGKNIDTYRQCLNEHLENYVSGNPDTAFYFFIPCYYISHYASFSSSDFNEMYTSFEVLADVFRKYSNVTYHYYGYYEYLYNNLYIYENGSDYLMNPDVANTLLRETFADGAHTFNADGLLLYISNFIDVIKNYSFTDSPSVDMSDTTIVILGDSIFGLPLYQNNTAIQNIVGNYSGAQIICQAVGGATACDMYNYDIPGLSQQLDIDTLNQLISSQNKPDNKLLFIIEFGLNDYTLGYEIHGNSGDTDYSTFAGALQTSVNTIKQEWPQSDIVFITPGYINQKNYGEVPSTASNHPLSEYRNTMINIAAENNCGCVNLADIGITPENCDVYLYGDAIHYNGIGRYYIARYLLNYLSANY